MVVRRPPHKVDGTGPRPVNAFSPAVAPAPRGALVAWQDMRRGVGDIRVARIVRSQPYTGRTRRIDGHGPTGQRLAPGDRRRLQAGDRRLGGRARRALPDLRPPDAATLHRESPVNDDLPRSSRAPVTALPLAATAVLIALNAFFVTAEYALVRARQSRLEALKEEGAEERRSRRCEQIDDIGDYISASQVGVTLISIGDRRRRRAGARARARAHLPGGGSRTASRSSRRVPIAYLIITSAHIVFGELVPKFYVDPARRGRRAADRAAVRVLQPAVRAVHRGPDRDLRTASCACWASIPSRPGEEERTPEELKAIIAEARGRARWTRARPACSPASSTCTSRRRARS